MQQTVLFSVSLTRPGTSGGVLPSPLELYHVLNRELTLPRYGLLVTQGFERGDSDCSMRYRFRVTATRPEELPETVSAAVRARFPKLDVSVDLR